ncbi:MAG: hypothetical protein FJ301_01665 [Planctomycetes bacterium]|nr:hypothetical protein [Planctomycetota bacterium]
MTTSSQPSLEQLRAALHDAAAAPADHAAAMAALRRARIAGGPLAAELLAVEVRWLARQWEALGLPAAGAAALAPFGLLLLQPHAAQSPRWWALGAVLWMGLPMVVAFGVAVGRL